MARVGCQEHTVEQWLSFKKADIVDMAIDAEEWYDLYWEAWTSLLKKCGNLGTYSKENEK